LLDGIEARGQIFVLATTNQVQRPDSMMASKQFIEPLTPTKPVQVSMQGALSDAPGNEDVAFLPLGLVALKHGGSGSL
jgi:hypothetical protein